MWTHVFAVADQFESHPSFSLLILAHQFDRRLRVFVCGEKYSNGQKEWKKRESLDDGI